MDTKNGPIGPNRGEGCPGLCPVLPCQLPENLWMVLCVPSSLGGINVTVRSSSPLLGVEYLELGTKTF